MNIEWQLRCRPDLRCETRGPETPLVPVEFLLENPMRFLREGEMGIRSLLNPVTVVRVDRKVKFWAEVIAWEEFFLGLLGYFYPVVEGGLFLALGDDESCFVVHSDGNRISIIETDADLYLDMESSRDGRWGGAAFYKVNQIPSRVLVEPYRRWADGITVDVRTWLFGMGSLARQYAALIDFVASLPEGRSDSTRFCLPASRPFGQEVHRQVAIEISLFQLSRLVSSLADWNLRQAASLPERPSQLVVINHL